MELEKKKNYFISVWFNLNVLPLASTERHVYGVMWNECTNDSKVFLYFIGKVMKLYGSTCKLVIQSSYI